MPYFVKLFFTIFLIMSLSSCGSDDGTADENTTTSETEDDDSTIGEIIGDTIGEVIDDSLENENSNSSDEAFDELENETEDETSSGNETDDSTIGEIIGGGVGEIIDNTIDSILDDNMTEEADDTVGEPLEDLVDGNSSIAPEEPVVEEQVDDGFIPVDEVELTPIIDEFNQTIGFYDTGSELSWYYNGLATYQTSAESCENRGERLPTISELVRIIDPMTEKGVPAFLEDSEYFDVGAVIWSSTIDPVYGVEGNEDLGIETGGHLSGTIYYGVDIFNDKLNDEEHYSFCVSGTNKKLGMNIADREISRTDDGVVTDNTFRLVWEDRDSVLVPMNYEEAEIHCANLDLNDKDWRLPTFRELFSLVDHSKANQTTYVTGEDVMFPTEILDKPAKIYGHFKNIPEVVDGDLLNYWTSNSKFGKDRAWTVKFADGRNNYPLLSDTAYIRCVADLNSEREFLPTAGSDITGEDTPAVPTIPINN
jgi:hypothetical protein